MTLCAQKSKCVVSLCRCACVLAKAGLNLLGRYVIIKL
jgi:hypothetical protein